MYVNRYERNTEHPWENILQHYKFQNNFTFGYISTVDSQLTEVTGLRPPQIA